MEYKTMPSGQVALVIMDEKGRVCQLAMDPDQNRALQIFIKDLSKTKPFVKMGENYDLVLKSQVKKLKKLDIEN